MQGVVEQPQSQKTDKWDPEFRKEEILITIILTNRIAEPKDPDDYLYAEMQREIGIFGLSQRVLFLPPNSFPWEHEFHGKLLENWLMERFGFGLGLLAVRQCHCGLRQRVIRFRRTFPSS